MESLGAYPCCVSRYVAGTPERLCFRGHRLCELCALLIATSTKQCVELWRQAQNNFMFRDGNFGSLGDHLIIYVPRCDINTLYLSKCILIYNFSYTYNILIMKWRVFPTPSSLRCQRSNYIIKWQQNDVISYASKSPTRSHVRELLSEKQQCIWQIYKDINNVIFLIFCFFIQLTDSGPLLKYLWTAKSQ